jgi:hypothetical protein
VRWIKILFDLTYERETEEGSKGIKIPLELTPGHLLGIPFHLLFQKHLRANELMR